MGIEDDGIAGGDHGNGIAGHGGQAIGNGGQGSNQAVGRPVLHGKSLAGSHGMGLQRLRARRLDDGAAVLHQLVRQAAITGLHKFLGGFLVNDLQEVFLDLGNKTVTVLGGIVLHQDLLGIIGGLDRFLYIIKNTKLILVFHIHFCYLLLHRLFA